jgi:hypothetical protein
MHINRNPGLFTPAKWPPAWKPLASKSRSNHLGQATLRAEPRRLPLATRALLVCRAQGQVLKLS